MKSINNRFFRAVLVSLGLLFFAATSAQAATCKGLGKSSCAKQSSCTWVGSYTRKDGVKVNAYCRTLNKKSGNSKLKKKTKNSSSSSSSRNKSDKK